MALLNASIIVWERSSLFLLPLKSKRIIVWKKFKYVLLCYLFSSPAYKCKYVLLLGQFCNINACLYQDNLFSKTKPVIILDIEIGEILGYIIVEATDNQNC